MPSAALYITHSQKSFINCEGVISILPSIWGEWKSIFDLERKCHKWWKFSIFWRFLLSILKIVEIASTMFRLFVNEMKMQKRKKTCDNNSMVIRIAISITMGLRYILVIAQTLANFRDTIATIFRLYRNCDEMAGKYEKRRILHAENRIIFLRLANGDDTLAILEQIFLFAFRKPIAIAWNTSFSCVEYIRRWDLFAFICT